ncbi:TIGR04076 family protein [Caproiciproducens sp. CPB-2]|uniref:TIGR04076 family protein n=1 Tax=Caproiciproducens sp. CPB-2 TaxID=3030017 RepID=UPI0023DCAB41|nr:TIGR04076 family protein [Caproiciproducens sp. CPB-2]MDF1493161.1 TIGR04076 family protein [Caproiciproducens sp. CPB-2]
MKRVKITVLETNYNEKLVSEYAVKGLTRCPVHQVGQVFYADYRKPEGLCDEAWKVMQHYAFALSNGMDGKFFDGVDPWIRHDNVAILNCTDGMRPVVFKLERTDEDVTEQCGD